MVSKGAVVFEIIVLYRNLWEGFHDTCETPLRLDLPSPRLKYSVSLKQVTAFDTILSLLSIQ